MKRANYEIIGNYNQGPKEYDIEIFDDTDLYQVNIYTFPISIGPYQRIHIR